MVPKDVDNLQKVLFFSGSCNSVRVFWSGLWYQVYGLWFYINNFLKYSVLWKLQLLTWTAYFWKLLDFVFDFIGRYLCRTTTGLFKLYSIGFSVLFYVRIDSWPWNPFFFKETPSLFRVSGYSVLVKMKLFFASCWFSDQFFLHLSMSDYDVWYTKLLQI